MADLHAAFAGRQVLEDGSALTCAKLVEMYLDRIAAINDYPQAGGVPVTQMRTMPAPVLPSIPQATSVHPGGRRVRGVLRINPAARAEAARLDALYTAEGLGARPLHCVPMLLKDNYDTFDHPSTSGSYSMLGHQAGVDAHSVAGLRRAGALILGKANQDEFAFSTSSTSGRGPKTSNPYDTSQDAGGSSSGTGASIASNFATIGAGTDTCMSIRFPASVNGLAGIRPSVGLVSQHGVFPLIRSRDAPGPMARTVRDAVLALTAMAGADPRDPRTLQYEHPRYHERPKDYVPFLNRVAHGLRGKKLAWVRSATGMDFTGSGEHVELIKAAITKMRALGAEVYDVDFPSFRSAGTEAQHYEWNDYFRQFEAENGFAPPRRCVSSSKPGINACTAQEGILETGLVAPPANASVALVVAQDPLNPPVGEAFNIDTRNYVHGVMDHFVTPGGQIVRLDALLIRPGESPNTCNFGSSTQMPSFVVPIGFTSDGVPKGIEFIARKWDEPTIIGLAYDYEQATLHRRPPTLAANPLAGHLVVEEFNRAQEQVLAAALDEDPWSIPVAEYKRILEEYVGVTLTTAEVEALISRASQGLD